MRPLLAALPPLMPGNTPADLPIAEVSAKRWNVIHACESTEPVIPLAQAQLEAGMRPALLTPTGWFNPGLPPSGVPPLSLVHAWRNVRHWRTLFDSESVGHPGEILHAHCFSAGMAAVRGALAVVYDVAAPLGTTPKAGPWLLRSMHVAESFVISRASAVVVHSQQVWSWALEQGARAEELFLVPNPIAIPTLLFDETPWLSAIAGARPAVTLFSVAPSTGDALSSLLRSFAILAGEVEAAHLLIETDAAAAVRTAAASLNLSDSVHPVSHEDRERSLSACDIVIAGASANGPNPDAIDALAYGRALLAADVPTNREVSSNGRGCLWYTAGNERDLAFRASFLARNPDFRAGLAISGRAHIQATRGFVAVARRYDDVYRHAIKRHRSGRRPDIFHHVPVLACC